MKVDGSSLDLSRVTDSNNTNTNRQVSKRRIDNNMSMVSHSSRLTRQATPPPITGAVPGKLDLLRLL